jgi:hypothetical protein
MRPRGRPKSPIRPLLALGLRGAARRRRGEAPGVRGPVMPRRAPSGTVRQRRGYGHALSHTVGPRQEIVLPRDSPTIAQNPQRARTPRRADHPPRARGEGPSPTRRAGRGRPECPHPAVIRGSGGVADRQPHTSGGGPGGRGGLFEAQLGALDPVRPCGRASSHGLPHTRRTRAHLGARGLFEVRRSARRLAKPRRTQQPRQRQRPRPAARGQVEGPAGLQSPPARQLPAPVPRRALRGAARRGRPGQPGGEGAARNVR